MESGYRFAVQVLMFDCERTIVQMLDNCGPFAEKIYITYSELPWTYNKGARDRFRNSTDKEIIKKSRYFSKIELIEGLWETDEDQRNFCLKKAKEDGFDFLIIQDADEFYTSEDYEQNIKEIISNPDCELYLTEFRPFWKDLHHVLVNKRGMFTDEKGGGYSEFAINCKKNVSFTRSRLTNANQKLVLSGVCYHLSYVHSDEEIWKKISIWGHSHQFNREDWYRRKWLMWNESTQNLHPLNPGIWKKAVYYEGTLPKELASIEVPNVVQYQTDFVERIADIWHDLMTAFLFLISGVRNRIKKMWYF